MIQDNYIWFLDFQSRSIKPLMNLTEKFTHAFSGGVSFKSSIIMLLLNKPKAYLFHYRDGKIKGLSEIDSPNYSQIEVKHRSSGRIVFLVRSHDTSERGDNPLFVFDGERLSQIEEFPELYDAMLDPSGRRIAYCYWEGDKRHIAVGELK